MGQREDILLASPIVGRLRDEFLPVVQQLSDSLSPRFTDREFSVYAWTVGSLTSYQGYDIGIECGFPNLTNWEQLLVLSFGLAHITTKPQMEASVSWNPGPDERQFPDSSRSDTMWLEATDAAFTELRQEVPHLVAAFVAAVERGQPQRKMGEL